MCILQANLVHFPVYDNIHINMCTLCTMIYTYTCVLNMCTYSGRDASSDEKRADLVRFTVLVLVRGAEHMCACLRTRCERR